MDEPKQYEGSPKTLPEERELILRYTPDTGRFLEVGTLRGVSIAMIAEKRPNVRFVSVDIHPFNRKPIGNNNLIWWSNRHPNQTLFIGNIVEFNEITSSEVFDVIFIDADHDYASVKRDLEISRRLIKPSGIIICHDYAPSNPANQSN